jgi:hypothetical protein
MREGGKVLIVSIQQLESIEKCRARGGYRPEFIELDGYHYSALRIGNEVMNSH